MLHAFRTTTSAIVAFAVALCCTAVGQQSTGLVQAGPADPPAKESLTPELRESRPPIFYLPDKQGNLQALLEFPHEEFADLLRLRTEFHRRDEPPEFNLDRIAMQGTAGASFAEVAVRVDLSLRSDRWVRVPLEMTQAVLRGPVVYKGGATQFVQYEEGAGYVCWIRGRPDTEHQISFRLLVALEKSGHETGVRFSVARATVSEMRFGILERATVAALADSASLISQMQGRGGGTDLLIAGLDKDFHVSWRNPGSESSPSLDALGAVDVRFDGRAIVSQARLKLRSYQGTLHRIFVRLPPQMEPVSVETGSYSIMPLGRDRDSEDRRTVEVRLRRRTANPVEVAVKCRREYLAKADSPACELAGFDVIGAVCQTGTITIAAPRQWKIVWTQSTGVRQIEVIGASLKHEGITSFEYYAIPYSLPIQFLPNRAALTVEPEYTLSVAKQQIGLNGRLKCRIDGSTISQLELELPDWRVDQVGPAEVVALDRVVSDGHRVVIPFVQPMTGDIEVSFAAHQRHKPGTSSLVAPLPWMKKAATTNASLTVVMAANVEVTPNDAMKGLLRRRLPTPQQGVPQQQEAWQYLCTDNRPVFAADFRVFPQQVAVDVTSQIKLSGRRATIEQCFSYSISYEPIDRLVLAVPRLLTGENRVQILCDGQPLRPGKVLGEAAETDDFSALAVGVMLPEPRMGLCDVVLRYSAPVGDQTFSGEESLHIPLIMPVDGRLAANVAILRSDRSSELSPRFEHWTRDDFSTSASSRSGLRLTSSNRANVLTVDVVREDGEGGPTVVVERAWIQTRLASSLRQDRLVCQFETERDDLEIILPPGALARSTKVLVNGQVVRPRVVSKSRLLVPLPRGVDQPRQPPVMEMIVPYYQTVPNATAGRLELPQVAGRTWYRKVYWQLDLPSTELLVSAAGDWNEEYRWGWANYFWQPLPTLNQEQLEGWAKAVSGLGNAGPTNTYLFSAFGAVEPITVCTVGRTWIIVGASACVLLLALLLLQVRALRHPAILLVLGVSLLAGGLVYPVATLLLAQAAAAGMLVTILAVLLRNSLRYLVQRKKVASAAESEGRSADASPTNSVSNGFGTDA